MRSFVSSLSYVFLQIPKLSKMIKILEQQHFQNVYICKIKYFFLWFDSVLKKGAYRSEKMENSVFKWRWSSKFITWHCIENISPWAAMELSIERWKKQILLCTFLAHRSQILFCLPFLYFCVRCLLSFNV